jgi:hypothetical protein
VPEWVARGSVVSGEPAALGVVIDRIAAEIDAAQRRHEVLRERVSHVPGGAVYVPDDMEDGGIGFMRSPRHRLSRLRPILYWRTLTW